MNYKALTFMLVAATSCGFGFAQTGSTTVVEDFKPTATTQEGKQYPQVNSERRVRASISAPTANKVQLDIGGKKYDMVKNANGVWTGESGAQDEGFHC